MLASPGPHLLHEQLLNIRYMHHQSNWRVHSLYGRGWASGRATGVTPVTLACKCCDSCPLCTLQRPKSLHQVYKPQQTEQASHLPGEHATPMSDTLLLLLPGRSLLGWRPRTTAPQLCHTAASLSSLQTCPPSTVRPSKPTSPISQVRGSMQIMASATACTQRP
jgi:hypothetical protein